MSLEKTDSVYSVSISFQEPLFQPGRQISHLLNKGKYREMGKECKIVHENVEKQTLSCRSHCSYITHPI